MKTTSWQTKALTLFIAAVALWLTAACGNGGPTIEPQPTPERTETSTQPVTESPIEEATETPTAETPEPSVECTHQTPETRSWLNTTDEEFQEHDEKRSRAGDVLYEHSELFWHQPNVYHVGDSFLRDETGEWTNEWGITVWVTEKVDQGTLSPEDRIPEILNDVHIRIVEAEPPPRVAMSRCDYSTCRVNLKKGDTTMDTTNRNTPERRHEVRLKYDPLFWRQPNVFGVGEGAFSKGYGATVYGRYH